VQSVTLAAAHGLADAGPVGGAEAGAGEAVALDGPVCQGGVKVVEGTWHGTLVIRR
jgi:hypothetical protein